jgi:hypothetical protein
MKTRNPEKIATCKICTIQMQAKKQFLSRLMRDAASFRSQGIGLSFAIRKAWLLRLRMNSDYRLNCDLLGAFTVNVMLGQKQVGSITLMSDGYFLVTNCFGGKRFVKSKIEAFEFSVSNNKRKEDFQFSLL